MAKKTKKSKQSKKSKKITISFPKKILEPIAKFLSRETKRLEKRKKSLSKRDPFRDSSRVADNAASDTDAAEQDGHAQVTAMQRQTERRLIQIRKALTRIKLGKYGSCERCNQMIDTDRLMVMPEATICIQCEKKKEN